MTTPSRMPRLAFVTGVNRLSELAKYLAASPCLQEGGLPWSAHFNVSSAAQAFNAEATSAAEVDWLVWVHQDVFLPAAWQENFTTQLHGALRSWPDLAVAGVYGITGKGVSARRAGHVLDRGRLLKEAEPLPCLADSLDELLVAVRVNSGLRMDPALGFDFYATDLVLQAKAQRLSCAILDAYCEHWSTTTLAPPVCERMVSRIASSAAVFESKWSHALPVSTSCFDINHKGDVSAFLKDLS